MVAVASPPAAPAPRPLPHHVLVAVELPPSVQACAAARATVRDLLDQAGRLDLVETASLLTSELVANAVLHAGAPVGLVVDLDARRLVVEVIDGSSQAPTPGAAEPMATGGRGLDLVDQLSHSWGVDQVPAGKSVWFSLRS